MSARTRQKLIVRDLIVTRIGQKYWRLLISHRLIAKDFPNKNVNIYNRFRRIKFRKRFKFYREISTIWPLRKPLRLPAHTHARARIDIDLYICMILYSYYHSPKLEWAIGVGWSPRRAFAWPNNNVLGEASRDEV